MPRESGGGSERVNEDVGVLGICMSASAEWMLMRSHQNLRPMSSAKYHANVQMENLPKPYTIIMPRPRKSMSSNVPQK